MTIDDQADVIVNDLGEVALCDCGGVNLTVGAVTLHLQADELEDFYGLASAALELTQPPARPASPAEPAGPPPLRKDKVGRILH